MCKCDVTIKSLCYLCEFWCTWVRVLNGYSCEPWYSMSIDLLVLNLYLMFSVHLLSVMSVSLWTMKCENETLLNYLLFFHSYSYKHMGGKAGTVHVVVTIYNNTLFVLSWVDLTGTRDPAIADTKSSRLGFTDVVSYRFWRFKYSCRWVFFSINILLDPLIFLISVGSPRKS